MRPSISSPGPQAFRSTCGNSQRMQLRTVARAAIVACTPGATTTGIRIEPLPTVTSPTPISTQTLPLASFACPHGFNPVPGGVFKMGSPDGDGDADEHPEHPMTV